MKSMNTLKSELLALKKEMKELKKDNKNISKELKIKDEIIHDLDGRDYKSKYLNTSKESKKLSNKNITLTKKVDKYKDKLEVASKEIEDLKKKVYILQKKLKNFEIKDSSNSSIPSSQNRFKKVQSLREKSNKKQGGQKGHKGTTISVNKIEKLIKSGNVDVKTIEINKNNTNKNMEPIIRYEQDIIIKTVIKVFKYYPNKNGKYNIPKKHNNLVIYGDTLKAITMLLIHKGTMSMDKVTEYIKLITNSSINIRKSTLVNWNKYLSNKTQPILNKIFTNLLKSNIVHTDESPININGKNHQIHNYSNDKYTLQFVRKQKSKAAMEDIGFLNNYTGTLVHDHNRIQYNYGSRNAECNAHILRYLKSIIDLYNHNWAKELIELFKEILHNKHLLENKKTNCFDKNTLNKYCIKYDEIIQKAYKEYLKDYSIYHNDEINLIKRLEKYKENHLLFMYDFDVPFSNNRAEADIRPAKIKQKIGIFRSEYNANCYFNIRSVISTLIKNDKNIFDNIMKLFKNEDILLQIEGLN